MTEVKLSQSRKKTLKMTMIAVSSTVVWPSLAGIGERDTVRRCVITSPFLFRIHRNVSNTGHDGYTRSIDHSNRVGPRRPDNGNGEMQRSRFSCGPNGSLRRWTLSSSSFQRLF